MKNISFFLVSLFPLTLVASKVSPSITPTSVAINLEISQSLEAQAREAFEQLIRTYQPSAEHCRTLVCEAEGLNAKDINPDGIEPIIAHLLAGYKKVWLMDGQEERPQLNNLLKDNDLFLLFDELHIAQLLFPNRPITGEEAARIPVTEFVQVYDSMLYTPEGERDAILLFKAKIEGVRNNYLHRHLLGHHEEDIMQGYNVSNPCDEGCCCFSMIPAWQKMFERDKAAALKWIADHEKDYKEWFKTQEEIATIYQYHRPE